MGCNSPVAVKQPEYYLRFTKEVDSLRAPRMNFAMTHLMLEAETNIPGWNDAVAARDTIITQQGSNWNSVAWSSVIGWIDSLDEQHFQRISAVNEQSQVYNSKAFTEYGTRREYKGRTDTVIVSSHIGDMYIADTMRVVIY